MTDENKGNDGGEQGGGAPNTKNTDTSQAGTDPKKTEAGKQQPFESAKLSDEDFQKVFEDPRLFQHERFKQLNERAKQAQKYEEDRKKEEEKKLLEEKKYEELLKKKDEELATTKAQAKTAQVDNLIQIEAQKIGVVDLEAIVKLVDRANIKIGDDGVITGVAEAVKALVDGKPYLKGTSSQPNVGSGSNPAGGGQQGPPRFKASQLRDVTFYREHEKEIMEALKMGQIENDLPV